MKSFAELTEREILAIAITQEERDARIYSEFADALRDRYPASAKVFDGMEREEHDHHMRLLELFKQKFGDHIPLISRDDVRGFVKRKPIWLVRPLGLDAVREYAEMMELETKRFYETAARQSNDASIRQLLSTLAHEEQEHASLAEQLSETNLTPDARAEEEKTRRRMFVLQFIQPGLAGLMDGSVSTLAPLFAAAFATHATHETFLVGLAASVGAGISMGFAEALSDDGALTGRGHPWLRGTVCGLMTAIGGLGHTIPYLISSFWLATGIAILVVALELMAIAWVRHKYMDTPLLQASYQVVVGGVLVFLAGMLIGNS